MDDHEVLSQLDRRGRSAAAGVHAALAEHSVPAFDPDALRVVVDGTAVARGARFRWMSAAGIVVLAMAAAAAVLVVGDDDGGPADRVGVVEPARRFVAGHLPAGFAVSGVGEASSSSSESSESSPSGPMVLYGPDPSRPELAVAVSRIEEEVKQEDQPGSEVVTVGGRRLLLTESPMLVTQAGIVDVDGRQVFVLARDRSLLEAVAAAVAVGAGDRPEVEPASLPDGWEELGQFPSIEAGYGPITAMRAAFSGTAWSVIYERSPRQVLLVMSATGGPLDVAAGRLFATGSQDVEVRGHPAVLSRVEVQEHFDPGGMSTVTSWAVTWEERPGEVIRVGGDGTSREDVLAVAEGLVLADEATWDEVVRQSLRSVVGLGEDEVVFLGEGAFSDGSPWVLLVQRVWEGTEDDPTGEGTVGGPIEGGDRERRGRLQVRTTVDGDDVGVSAGAAPGVGVSPSSPFVDGISVAGGGALAWVYGLVSAEVATVELVGVDGDVLASAEVLVAEGYRGFLMELDRGLAPGPRYGGSGEGFSSEASTTMVGNAPDTPEPVDPPDDRPVVVARAVDGTELGRHSLP